MYFDENISRNIKKNQQLVIMQKFTSNSVADSNCFLYQSPKDKFSYHFIKKYSIGVNKNDRHILQNFSKNLNQIDYVTSFSILKNEFDKNFFRLLLSQKIRKRFNEFLSDFYDKHNFISFGRLLATEFSQKNVKAIYTKKNQDGDTFISAILENNKVSCSRVLTDILNLFGPEFFKAIVVAKSLNGNNLLQSICYIDDQRELENSLEVLLNFDKDFLRNVISSQNNYGNNFFHFVCSHNRKHLKVTRILKVLVNNFNKDWLKMILRSKSKDTGHEWTFLHYLGRKIDKPLDPDEWTELIDYLIKTFKKDFVKKLLTASDEKGRTFLHELCQNPKQIGVIEILQYLAKTFDQGFMKKLCAAKNSTGWTFLHSFSFSHQEYTWNPRTKDVNGMFDLLTKAFDAKYLQLLLSAQNTSGNTFLHNFAKYDPNEDFLRALDCLRHLQMNCHELLFLKNKYGNNCFQMKEMIFKDIYDILKQILNKSELEILLLQKGENNSLMLHYIKPPCTESSTFAEFLKFLENEFDLNFLKKLLKVTNDYSTSICTCLQYNLIHFNIISFQDFYKSMSNFDKDFMQEILTATNDDNSTLLYYFVTSNSNTNYVECFETLIKDFGKDFVRSLLIWKNDSHHTIILEMARYYMCVENVLEVLEFLLREFGVEYLQQHLEVAETHGGYTLLHYSLPEIVDIDLFTKLFNFLTTSINKDTLKTLLRKVTFADYTVIHSFSVFNSKTNFEEVLKILLKNFDKDFLKELLAMKKYDGGNFLHGLAGNNDNTSFHVLLKLLVNEFDKEFVRDLVKVKDIDGKTFMMHILWNDNVIFKEMFQILHRDYDVKQ